jgi:6-phosphogluconate dehydrogenase
MGCHSVQQLCASLKRPRKVMLMVKAGPPVDDFIGQVIPYLEPGDIIIDGGNTYYKDDIRRAAQLKQVGIRYLDAGVSGGIWGLQIGYCLMIGGDPQTFDALEPVFKTLAPSEGYLHCGPTGAGHFVKMVHNGIEYAMMQAYGEGFEILAASEYGRAFEFAKISHLWNQGSVVRSWLLELAEEAFKRDDSLDDITGYVEDSGEGRWTVQQAIDTGVPAEAITLSLFRRFRSRQKDPFAERVLAALRREFGGHAVVTSDKS